MLNFRKKKKHINLIYALRQINQGEHYRRQIQSKQRKGILLTATLYVYLISLFNYNDNIIQFHAALYMSNTNVVSSFRLQLYQTVKSRRL